MARAQKVGIPSRSRAARRHLAYAVIVNKAFWDGLPPDIRTTLEGALKDAIDYGNAASRKDNADAVVAIRATGKTEVTVLSPEEKEEKEEKEEWRQVLLPVHKEVEARIGRDLIQSVYETTGFGGAK